MLDRASTFSDPDLLAELKTRFIPVAIDQAYQRRQQDAEGDFYRQIAGQGPRHDFNNTTQGLYVAGPDGALLGFTNNRGSGRVREMMRRAIEKYQPGDVALLEAGRPDPRFNPHPPEGGLVVRVQAKVLDGYEETDDRWRQIFQSAVSRDNLWITREEQAALVRGEILPTLQQRIARFHLVDNTRGEPPMWRKAEIRELEMHLQDGVLSGEAELRTDSGDRAYQARLQGNLEVREGKVTRFEVVAQGAFRGEGRFTRGAPEGEFPLAVSFSLADGTDIADGIPPQGSRGWVEEYLKTE